MAGEIVIIDHMISCEQESLKWTLIKPDTILTGIRVICRYSTDAMSRVRPCPLFIHY